MNPVAKFLKVIVHGGNGSAGSMKSKTPKRQAALVAVPALLGLFLFLVLPFRAALFPYVLVAGLAYVLGKMIEARAMLGRAARWL